MNLKSRITTTRISRRTIALSLTAMLIALAAPIFAHGGFDHVSGTVVRVENNTLIVKTTKGNVNVRLDDKTEITRGDHKALVEDLKPGLRVVVDVPEGNAQKLAHSVKIGAPPTTDHK